MSDESVHPPARPLVFHVSDRRGQRLLEWLDVYVPQVFAGDDAPAWHVHVTTSTTRRLAERWIRSDIGVGRFSARAVRQITLLSSHYASVTREQLGLYTIHASAILAGGHAFLLCGHSGAGKSASLRTLIDLGVSPLAGNWAIIDARAQAASVVGATRALTGRLGAAGGSAISSIQFANTPWASVRCFPHTPVSIGAIFFLQSWPIGNRARPANRPGDRLFDAFCERPRLSVHVEDAQGVSFPRDTPTLTRRRADAAERIARAIPCFEVEGPAGFIAAEVLRLGLPAERGRLLQDAAAQDVVERCAGGVVLRMVGCESEVLLTQESGFPGWVLPKGKIECGESDEATARREIREETGVEEIALLADAGWHLQSARADGRLKLVHYFMFRHVSSNAMLRDRARWWSMHNLPSFAVPEQVDVVRLAAELFDASRPPPPLRADGPHVTGTSDEAQ